MINFNFIKTTEQIQNFTKKIIKPVNMVLNTSIKILLNT